MDRTADKSWKLGSLAVCGDGVGCRVKTNEGKFIFAFRMAQSETQDQWLL